MYVYRIAVYKSVGNGKVIGRYFEVTAIDPQDAKLNLIDFLSSESYEYRNIGIAFFERYGDLSLFDSSVVEISGKTYYGVDYTKSELKLI